MNSILHNDRVTELKVQDGSFSCTSAGTLEWQISHIEVAVSHPR